MSSGKLSCTKERQSFVLGSKGWAPRFYSGLSFQTPFAVGFEIGREGFYFGSFEIRVVVL